MLIRLRTAVSASMVVMCAAGAALALPPFVRSRTYYSTSVTQQSIPGVGVINNPFMPSSGSSVGGTGFMGCSINNSGVSSVLVNVFAMSGFNRAALNSSTGLNAYLAAGAEGSLGDPGSITVPSADYVYDNGFWTSITNSGNTAFSLGLRSSSFAAVSPINGLYFNKTAMPVKAGDPVTAAGVAAGTTFGNFSASGMVKLNDNNVAMIAGPIIESGVTKNAIIKVALNASGTITGMTLVAKEGGSVGAGPDTWSSISVAPPTCAMNNGGNVMFSGISTGGTNGIAYNNRFLVTQGSAAPGAQTWSSLFAVPLDLANTGQYVFRGVIGGSSVWSETGDAGEGFGNANGGGPSLSVQSTSGAGPISQITGTLSNDQDVDLYMITVGDPNAPTQTPFTATTVPNPGAGFAGANFDSVLYLFEYPANINGNTRPGIGRNDDAAQGVMQSTLTAASLPQTHTVGRRYILGISTPKSRAWANPIYGTPPATIDMWLPEPGQIAVGSTSGMLFWADAAHGQIGRSSLSSATLLSGLQVTDPPAQTNETQSNDPNSKLLSDAIAVYDSGANSKVFFIESGYASTKIRSCATDGSNITDVITGATTPDSGGASALAVDSVNSRLYWAASPHGSNGLVWTINTSDLTGGGGSILVSLGNTDTINAIAIDPTPVSGPGTGTLYWYNSSTGTISRSDFAGGNIQTVGSPAGVKSLAIDPTGRRLYYTTDTGNAIGVINIDTLASLSTLAAPNAPVGISFDATGGKLYWSTPLDRLLQRSSVASPSVQNWTSVGGDTAERPADGPGAFYGFAGFHRYGTAGSTALPYSIKLTGANFYVTKAMICRNNSIDVSGALSGTSPGYTASPVKISDRGVVAWLGSGGFYADQTLLVGMGTNIIGGGSVGQPTFTSARDMTMSQNGQHLLVQTFNGAFTGGGNTLVQIDFNSIPGCAADFNGDGVLAVQDIFDFLNAWFAGVPNSDFNGDGVLAVQDIFDFLNAWFGGC